MAIQDTVIPAQLNPEGFPPKAPGQSNIYKPSDIKRYGTNRFLTQVAPKEPMQPGFTFTDKEQRRMDELLAANEPA